MTDTTVPTTTFACPDWCTQVGCGGFDIEIATGQPIRIHERVVERGDGFTVWVNAKERITPSGSGLEPVHPSAWTPADSTGRAR